MIRQPLERHIVLVSPEIHWNTGNIGRSCLGAGAFLHLIKPLGFSLESREVKRAGLDYWDRVNLSVWDSFAAFAKKTAIDESEAMIFTKTGKHPVWQLPKTASRQFLIFGSETRGLPKTIQTEFRPEQTYHIPIRGDIRSLNLSTAVGIALYESLREAPDFHHWS